MSITAIVLIVIAALLVLALVFAAVKVIDQYERGVRFRLGRVRDEEFPPGLTIIIPIVDRLVKVPMRIVTLPIQGQGIITRDNVSVDVSAVAYYRVVDAIKATIAIEDYNAAIEQIAQTTLRAVVGKHSLDQTLSETDRLNQDIRGILATGDGGNRETGRQVGRHVLHAVNSDVHFLAQHGFLNFLDEQALAADFR